MPQRKAYLVVHKLALYNDEYYDDYTLEVNAANPASLHITLGEAQEAVKTLTRTALRGAHLHDLQPDELVSAMLERLHPRDLNLDPALFRAWQAFTSGRKPLPDAFTDTQMDQLVERTGLHLFHILETQADDFAVQLAGALLALTPERPVVELNFNEEEENDVARREPVQADSDTAAERLKRVTALFDRKYATWLPM